MIGAGTMAGPRADRIKLAPVRRSLWSSLIVFLCWIAAAPGITAAAADEPAAEYQIKAAFLYKFGSYVEWPDEAGGDAFTIAVTGADDLAAYLADMVRGRRLNGKPIEVRTLEPGETAPDIQVLFVGKSVQGAMSSILSGFRGRPVLTVTEADTAGGIINFVVVNNRVRFDIALGSAEQRKLRISARLLEVARQVVEHSS